MRISDWSSDVCSSDLLDIIFDVGCGRSAMLPDQFHNGRSDDNAISDAANDSGLFWCSYAKADCDGEIGIGFQASDGFFNAVQRSQIGRASCRESVWPDV